jgi:PEP-CTERM motif
MALAQFFHGVLTFGSGLVEVGKNAMKAHRFSWPIGGAVVLALLFCGAEQARATTIDFEDLGVMYRERLDILPAGMAVTTGGFLFTPGPINNFGPIDNRFNDLHISNQFPGDSYNGTTVGITHDDLIMTKVGDGTFSLQSFDFAGFPLNKEVPLLVTGVLEEDLSTITQTFNLGILPGEVDGKVDGDVWGGVDDFQTFYLDSKWTNLKSVTWIHTGYGTDRGLFALDNLVVDQPKTIPEPSTLTLLGFGVLCLMGQGWFARKRLKAFARMT